MTPKTMLEWLKDRTIRLLKKRVLKAQAIFMSGVKEKVSAAENPGKELTACQSSRLFTTHSADQFLMALLRERDPLFLRLLDHADDVNPPALRVVLQMYGADYRGLAVSGDEIRDGLRILKNAKWRARRPNALYFLLAAIKNGDLELVRSVLDAFPEFPLHTLPPAYKTGALRLAALAPQDVYAQWRQDAAPSPLEQLQIQDIDARAGFATPRPHAELGSALRDVVPAPMQSELDRRILPFYEAHSEHMRWMDCRSNPEEHASFIDDISEHLRNKRPYSLIRLGDGESYAWQDKVSAEHAARREQVWWGTPIDPALRAQIGREMHSAISNANRLGIPSLFRFTRDTHPGLGTYTEHVSIVGLIHVLDGLREMPKSSRLYTEERIHQLCFDLPTIAHLSADATKMVIVSSLTKESIESKLRAHIGTAPLEAIEVPTHTKTTGNDMFVQASKPLPFVYEEIAEQVKDLSAPGVLVLVASGSIGKIFCAAAQENGAVALDVGAMIDYWVGLKTRSIADMG
jgi:hypothetical protein